jgi:large subunit ribosomal protein L3
MIKGLLGKKLGMTSVFSNDGRSVPVTVIEAGPCTVTQIKTRANDGYDALQIGFGEKKKSRANKPLMGHCAKAGDKAYAFLREFSVDDPDAYKLGQAIDLAIFNVGDKIEVSGNTKGRGFAGTIKRHGFHRGPKTHGSKNYREPGSIGQCAWPSKVFKGKKMPGRYGATRNTVKNLEIIDIRPDQHLILVKGAIPGPTTGTVEIRKC